MSDCLVSFSSIYNVLSHILQFCVYAHVCMCVLGYLFIIISYLCVHYYLFVLTWRCMYIVCVYLMCNISYKCTCIDQLPTPVNTATFSNSTTAVLTVSFDPQCCNTAQLTVDITTTTSSATTPVVHPVDSTDPTNTTIVITNITEDVSYTASIQSVCEDNNLLEDSGVLVVNFMTNGECVHPCVSI